MYTFGLHVCRALAAGSLELSKCGALSIGLCVAGLDFTTLLGCTVNQQWSRHLLLAPRMLLPGSGCEYDCHHRLLLDVDLGGGSPAVAIARCSLGQPPSGGTSPKSGRGHSAFVGDRTRRAARRNRDGGRAVLGRGGLWGRCVCVDKMCGRVLFGW